MIYDHVRDAEILRAKQKVRPSRTGLISSIIGELLYRRKTKKEMQLPQVWVVNNGNIVFHSMLGVEQIFKMAS